MRGVLLFVGVVLVACGQPVPPAGDDAGVDGGSGFTDGGLDLNDVSWLVPLAPATQPSSMLGFDSRGARGPLLPRTLYDALPGMVSGLDPATMFDTWRVVSIRVDPCFPATATGGCLEQIRLVAQPLGVTTALQSTTEDGAIHLFYELNTADFVDVRATLTELKTIAGTETDGKPLDVHPVMKRQGLGGAYATKLFALVLRLCGHQNLTRVAFMRLVQQDVAWRFGALNVVNGQLVADPIPRLNDALEQGVQEFGSDDFRSGQLQPEAIGDQFPVLLSESEFRLTDQRTFDRAVTAALRIEHPARSSPKTMDCGSCHTASRSLRNANKERPFDVSQHEDRFVTNPRFNLARVDAVGDDPRAMRAFGYFGDQSALSQRTINESADIAEALSKSP